MKDEARGLTPPGGVRRALIAAGAATLAFGAAMVRAAAPNALPKGLSPPREPQRMPPFDLPTVGGTNLRSEALQGQLVLVRFWASW